MTKWLTTRQAAAKWGISVSRVRHLLPRITDKRMDVIDGVAHWFISDEIDRPRKLKKGEGKGGQ